MSGRRVGAVDVSQPASTGRFIIALDDDAVVQLDDLVVCEQALPDGRDVAHYGIIVEQSGLMEGATWSTDTHEAGENIRVNETARTAEVLVLRTDPELWVAPYPGSEVHLAAGVERERALFEDQMHSPLPLGLDQSGQIVNADFAFMNGEQGGHMSISGVSGVAAKTSFALHTLYSIFETDHGRRLLGAGAAGARGLVFNVKGEDLLHLDEPNSRFSEEAREQWRKLGVDNPRPFESVRFYVPPRPGGDMGAVAPNAVSRRSSELTTYGWTPEAFIRQGLLRFCFTDDEHATQVAFVEQVVRVQLARHAYAHGSLGEVILRQEPHTESKTFETVVARSLPNVTDPGLGTPITNYSEMLDFLIAKLDPDTGDPTWQGSAAAGTLMAFIRRLMALTPRIGHLIRCGVSQINLDTHVTVVDIHSLHDAAQMFVVGSLVSSVFESKQGTGREPLRFIVLDELNKYAPRNGRGPLRELLVDIAERGRSLGVILLGAQQAASRVAEPVAYQPALKVVGRLDAAEAAEYKFLTPEVRERATRVLPGTMILAQPIIPAPLMLRFPYPPYATNTGDAASTTDTVAAEAEAFAALEEV